MRLVRVSEDAMDSFQIALHILSIYVLRLMTSNGKKTVRGIQLDNPGCPVHNQIDKLNIAHYIWCGSLAQQSNMEWVVSKDERVNLK